MRDLEMQCGKAAYSTQAAARAAINVLRAPRNRKRPKPHRVQRAYRCPSCGAWHLSSQREQA